jgi:hypothetical protein
MGDSIKSHFVPQFFLRPFSIRRRDEVVYMYRRGWPGPKETSICNVAARRDLYRLQDMQTGETSQEVEHLYGRETESPAAPVIKRLLKSDRVELSAEERKVIAKFVGHLIARNPRQHKVQAAILEDRGSMLKWYTENREKAIAATMELGHTEEAAEELIGEILADPESSFDRWNKEGKNLFIGGALLVGQDFSEILLDRQWQLLVSDSSRVFVTSDNPVISIRPDGSNPSWPIDLGDTVIVVPISPKQCLAFSKGSGEGATLTLGREQIDRVNSNSILFAEWIFSNLNSRTIQSAVDASPAVEVRGKLVKR